jgi:hypothetical protein
LGSRTTVSLEAELPQPLVDGGPVLIAQGALAATHRDHREAALDLRDRLVHVPQRRRRGEPFAGEDVDPRGHRTAGDEPCGTDPGQQERGHRHGPANAGGEAEVEGRACRPSDACRRANEGPTEGVKSTG